MTGNDDSYPSGNKVGWLWKRILVGEVIEGKKIPIHMFDVKDEQWGVTDEDFEDFIKYNNNAIK